MKYNVDITRSESVTRTFTVTADDPEEAKRLALEEAYDHDWNRAPDATYIEEEPLPTE